ATEQFMSLGYLRQSMETRDIFASRHALEDAAMVRPCVRRGNAAAITPVRLRVGARTASARAFAAQFVPEYPFSSRHLSKCDREPLAPPGVATRMEKDGGDLMRKLLIGLTAAAALGVAVPASAQVYLGAGPGGVEVGVGGARHYARDYRYGHR